jgi:hypothetical protein
MRLQCVLCACVFPRSRSGCVQTLRARAKSTLTSSGAGCAEGRPCLPSRLPRSRLGSCHGTARGRRLHRCRLGKSRCRLRTRPPPWSLGLPARRCRRRKRRRRICLPGLRRRSLLHLFRSRRRRSRALRRRRPSLGWRWTCAIPAAPRCWRAFLTRSPQQMAASASSRLAPQRPPSAQHVPCGRLQVPQDAFSIALSDRLARFGAGPNGGLLHPLGGCRRADP